MKLYVSNLGFHVSDSDLNTLFAAFGPVTSAKVITDRETGRSRGFGFIEMESETEATQAMSKLNNKEIEGRQISVSVARDREARPANNRRPY